MAVVMPDTSCKPYFIMLDVYKLFDVSAGEDMANTRTYALIENLLNIYEEILSTNMVNIKSIINLLSDSFLLMIDEINMLKNKLNEMLEENKLYITKDDLLELPFIKNYFYEFLNASEKATINYAINIYKSLLFKLKDLFSYEATNIHNIIILMDKLLSIYKNIPELIKNINPSSEYEERYKG